MINFFKNLFSKRKTKSISQKIEFGEQYRVDPNEILNLVDSVSSLKEWKHKVHETVGDRFLYNCLIGFGGISGKTAKSTRFHIGSVYHDVEQVLVYMIRDRETDEVLFYSRKYDYEPRMQIDIYKPGNWITHIKEQNENSTVHSKKD